MDNKIIKKMQSKIMYIKTPAGNTVPITFGEYCTHCYNLSNEKKTLSFKKYYLLKSKALSDGWDALNGQVETQAEKNSRWYMRAFLYLKYKLIIFKNKHFSK